MATARRVSDGAPPEAARAAARPGQPHAAEAVLRLQRTAGNSAVAASLRSDGGASGVPLAVQRIPPKTPNQKLGDRAADRDAHPRLRNVRADLLGELPQGRRAAYEALTDRELRALALLRGAREYALGIADDMIQPARRAGAATARAEVAALLPPAAAAAAEIAAALAFRNALHARIAALRTGSPADQNVGDIIASFATDVENEREARYLASEFMAHRPADPRLTYNGFLADATLVADPMAPQWVRNLVAPVLALARAEPRRARRLYLLARRLRELRGMWFASEAVAMLTAVLRPQLDALVYAFQPAPHIAVTWSLRDDVQRDGTGVQVAANDPFLRVVDEAWTVIRRVVSPAVLAQMRPCAVRLHSSWLTRPYHSNGTIHVGPLHGASTLLHEFGHHLEDEGNVTRWVAIHQMLYDRSGGRDLQSVFPFTIPWVISSDELQYDATMPAWWYTGGWFGYSAKYYSSGSTEVVSTTMEILNQPDRMFEVAVNDPELFIRVLAMLRA